MKVLVVDDEKVSRIILSQNLKKSGYAVETAANGKEAWDILLKESISLVISDWMMPVMDGLELCRKIRAGRFPGYIFFILVTSRDSNCDLIAGMDAGADDFVVKPFNNDELNARIRAGERILKLEKDLAERNRALKETNKKLNQAYSIIKKDLQAAAKIQSSLLPQSDSIIYGVQFDWIFLPSTYVAGDIFNYFRLDDNHIGFYLLDVAGHGIPASMLSVTLSKVLSTENNKQCILKKQMEAPPYYEVTPPSVAIQILNQRFQSDAHAMQYFTMVYGIIDKRDGRTVMAQAGHPPPVYLKQGLNAVLIGSGGYPVGMFPDLDYEEDEIYLSKGDRLFFYSDGITECTNEKNEQFSIERLMRLLEQGQHLSLRGLLDETEHRLHQWKGNIEFEDDVTLMALNMV